MHADQQQSKDLNLASEEIRLQLELVANGLCALGIGWLPNVLGHSFYVIKCSFIFLEDFIIIWFTRSAENCAFTKLTERHNSRDLGSKDCPTQT